MDITQAAENFGPSIPGSRKADITELALGVTGLRVVVAVGEHENGENRYLEIMFTDPRGFRYLDEGDLLPYWRGGVFNTLDHLVFEIKRGGWAEQEQHAGMLNVTAAFGGHREWFIASQNGCLNVISRLEPIIRSL